MKIRKIVTALLLVSVIWAMEGQVWAEQKININVKTVLASHGRKYSDPLLTAFINKLKSIFRYSSYQLLSQNEMRLGIGETRTASLAGDRTLKITALGIGETRAELRLVIFKKRKRIFKTIIHLLNNASIIVGGPKYKDGFLLFNIYGSF